MYVNANHLLTDKQFGFRPKHSKITALSSFADDVLRNMECGKLCGTVFLDLSKACDTVDHRIILSKWSSLGPPNAVGWFQSYLSHRMQRTLCCSELSDVLPVTYGVPQGSILWPLLFLVYIYDLSTIVKHSRLAFPFMQMILFCTVTRQMRRTWKICLMKIYWKWLIGWMRISLHLI